MTPTDTFTDISFAGFTALATVRRLVIQDRQNSINERMNAEARFGPGPAGDTASIEAAFHAGVVHSCNETLRALAAYFED